jgi:hypothetical protein
MQKRRHQCRQQMPTGMERYIKVDRLHAPVGHSGARMSHERQLASGSWLWAVPDADDARPWKPRGCLLISPFTTPLRAENHRQPSCVRAQNWRFWQVARFCGNSGPDVADLLVDLPGAQRVVRGSTQQPCCTAIHLAQPDRPVGPLDDDGHPVLEPCSSTFASVVIVAKVCKSSPSGDFHISHTPRKRLDRHRHGPRGR